MPMFEACAMREHSEIWCIYLKRQPCIMNNIYEVDFFVELCSTDIEDANKNKQSWGYGLTFFSRVD